MKIYTKTGDKGTTSLLGGTRVSKAHIRVDAYGSIDELNAYIGWLRDLNPVQNVNETLLHIQRQLFTIGGILASAPDKNTKKQQMLSMDEKDVLLLEKEIDRMNESLPPQKHFILPGGHPVVSSCHIARNVCRRAERKAVLLHETEGVPELILEYLNRLSDYLFVLARKLTVELNAEEIKWTADNQ